VRLCATALEQRHGLFSPDRKYPEQTDRCGQDEQAHTDHLERWRDHDSLMLHRATTPEVLVITRIFVTGGYGIVPARRSVDERLE